MKSLSLILALLLALVLAITSLFVGVSNVSLTTLFAPDTSADALRVLLVSRIPRTLAGFACAFWALCGIVGLVLALAWAFTEHRALWANRNLLLFDPLCLLLLPGAWALLRGRAPSRRFRLLLVAVAMLAALACLPLWLQALPQRNGNWIALLLPIHAAFARAWAKRKA